MSLPYQSQVDALERAGYVQVERSGRFVEGQRVHHIGEKFPAAHQYGTGEIVSIFERGGRHASPEVEIIVRRDDAEDVRGAYGYWANYHTVLIPEGGSKL
jgi:hypothetical protein